MNPLREQVKFVLQNFAVCRDKITDPEEFDAEMSMCFGRDPAVRPIDDLFKKAENKLLRLFKLERIRFKKDLIKIADAGEYEDLRREVENYFRAY